MKKLLLITILIGGCATTYTPEQLQAKASDKSDIDLCFDMILNNPNQYSKQELMNRGTNCNTPDIANAVIEKREQQIRTAQMLMAFGNALKGQPVMNVPAMGTLPNYSSRKTMYIKESETIAGFNKICVYSFGATKTTRTIGATDLCPLSVSE